VFPIVAPGTTPLPLPMLVAVVLVTLLVLALSVRPARNILSTDQLMNTAFDPLHLVNTYGAFGSITKRRFQIVVEGTTADDPDEDDWVAYEFKGQPVAVDERPPQWAPYHLRLDWQLWFAAMSPSPRRHPWFLRLLEQLLDGDEAALGLLASNPFPDEPPTQVRALRYQYRFTTPEQRASTGRWWTRERVGTYVRPVSSDEVRDAGVGRQRRFR
jgi:hypothetical protein